MIEFQSAFMESNGEPIKYKGKTLIMADKIPVNKEFKITLKLISTNSKWKQAININVKTGNLLFNNVKSKSFILWEENLKRETEQTIEIYGKTNGQFISVWNTCEVISKSTDGIQKCNESWTMGCAMIKGENGVYYCNDFDPDDDFDDLIFQIKVE